MPGEAILIVEDSPVSLKLTATVLRADGYKVQIASSAEQALSMLRFLKPQLMLVDILLPGMSGLELTSKVKLDPRLQETIVVALTGCAMDGDEERARAAGCDGYLTKPIDAPTLLVRVREYLEHRDAFPVPPDGRSAEPDPEPKTISLGLPECEMEDLRRSFLVQGSIQSRHLLESVNGRLDAPEASRLLHQWTGVGGLLGFPTISKRSREVEVLLKTPPWNIARLRESLMSLVQAFSAPGEVAEEVPIPESIVRELKGKRVGLIGLADLEAERVCAALERVGAKPRLFATDDSPELASIRECNAVMIHVRPETMSSAWLSPGFLVPPVLPVMFVGEREHLLSLDPRVQSRAREFLIDGWQPEEALLRLSFAISRTVASALTAPAGTYSGTESRGITSVPGAQTQSGPVAMRAEMAVIADDDETVRTLVRSALQRFGWQCRLASNGSDALQIVREHRPQAAVLDVNMPGMDGFEVLAVIRAEAIPVRVILLTARQLENDILRGFSLGADDYVVKPFNPMELVARLRRLSAT
jgi:two-component system, cell cycle response regulator DivK